MSKEHMLVIGGSKGTGRAIVQTMAEKGYTLSVISRTKPQEECENAAYWAVDITKGEALAEALEQIVTQKGRINHLVFCQQFRGTEDDWQGQIDTSLTATKSIIESAGSLFDEAKGNASITMIGSSASHFIAKEKSVGYHVVKAGLEQMIRYYALVLAPRGIRVNGLSPNTILKEENRDFYRRTKELHDLNTRVSPLGRMVTSEDVAHGVAFLCSPHAGAVTGQSLVMDGGASLQEHAGLARALKSLDKIEITQG